MAISWDRYDDDSRNAVKRHSPCVVTMHPSIGVCVHFYKTPSLFRYWLVTLIRGNHSRSERELCRQLWI